MYFELYFKCLNSVNVSHSTGKLIPKLRGDRRKINARSRSDALPPLHRLFLQIALEDKSVKYSGRDKRLVTNAECLKLGKYDKNVRSGGNVLYTLQLSQMSTRESVTGNDSLNQQFCSLVRQVFSNNFCVYYKMKCKKLRILFIRLTKHVEIRFEPRHKIRDRTDW